MLWKKKHFNFSFLCQVWYLLIAGILWVGSQSELHNTIFSQRHWDLNLNLQVPSNKSSSIHLYFLPDAVVRASVISFNGPVGIEDLGPGWFMQAEKETPSQTSGRRGATLGCHLTITFKYGSSWLQSHSRSWTKRITVIFETNLGILWLQFRSSVTPYSKVNRS